jgi:hypothetical protein
MSIMPHFLTYPLTASAIPLLFDEVDSDPSDQVRCPSIGIPFPFGRVKWVPHAQTPVVVAMR